MMRTHGDMLNNNVLTDTVEKVATRDGFGDGLVEIGGKNENIVVLTGDLAESTRVHTFAEKFPDRFIEVGIAEQNMVSIAAGLALTGKIPFVSTYAVFVPGRAWDQIRIDIGYQQTNVKLAGAHAGISVGPDGATHQAMEDIATMRCLPNMTVLVPCDYHEAKKVTIAAAEHQGGLYFRFARHKSAIITTEITPFAIGKAQVFRDGTDVAILGAGPIVYDALVAAQRLAEKGIEARVINSPSIKPLDEETILLAAMECGAIVTCEEHQRMGGFGSAVAEFLATKNPTPQEFVAMPDRFGESGTTEELLHAFGLDADGIVDAVGRVLQRKE